MNHDPSDGSRKQESFMRKPFVAGNWKMNTDSQSSVDLAEGIASGSLGVAGKSVTVAVCPPFVYLQPVARAVGKSDIAVGAQDIYFEAQGRWLCVCHLRPFGTPARHRRNRRADK
jgi:hypothetical protein